MHEPFCEDLESASQERARPSSIVKVGFLFESALVLVALGLGHWLQQSAWQNLAGPTLWKTLQAVGIGLLATAPMLGVLVITLHLPYAPVRQLCQLVDEQLMPLFAEASLMGLLLLSLAAGFGEEMLFRGVLQDWLANWLEGDSAPWVALLLVSLLFGVCHWVTTAYAVFAAIIGLYLGMLYWVSGSLLTAVVAHAAYDFVALVWLLRTRPVAEGK
ncbi:MAG: CPBP family intramembrane glutamic endopeptidase [Pirellulaceae bacterium]